MKSRLKNNKRRRRTAKNRGPDDCFAAGPFKITRYGMVMVTESSQSPEHWQRAQARMAAEFPTGQSRRYSPKMRFFRTKNGSRSKMTSGHCSPG
jgi:hypothetical protein